MGQIVYNVKVTLPEPLDVIGVKAHTENSGKSYSIELDLPEDISKEAVASYFGKVIATLRAETQRIEKAKVAVAEQKRQAAEAQREKITAQMEAEARQVRIAEFNQSDAHPISLAKAQELFPGTPFKVRAGSHHGAGISAKGKLKFLFAVMEPHAGTGAFDKFYWFDPADRSVDSICPRCAGDLHLAASGHGYAIVSCNTETCSFRERRERPVERVKSVMNPAAFSLVG